MKFGTMRGICAYQVVSYFGELWSTFVGAQIFDSEYPAHFFSDRNEIWQPSGSGQSTLVPRIS